MRELVAYERRKMQNRGFYFVVIEETCNYPSVTKNVIYSTVKEL
jgi:hypothetical protein